MSESEDESEEAFDIYGADPVFDSKEELEEFMKSCNIQLLRKDNDHDKNDPICYDTQKKIEAKCSCGNCEVIWSGDFQHICCQQIEGYVEKLTFIVIIFWMGVYSKVKIVTKTNNSVTYWQFVI